MNCSAIAGFTMMALLAFIFYTLITYETFQSFYEQQPNNNAFGNYYRVGYHQGKPLGWKPSNTWDHLTPC